MRYNSTVLSTEIRRATFDDYARLLELHRALHVHVRAELVPAARHPLYAYRSFDRILAEDLRGMLDSRDQRVWVAARADGSLVGYVTGRIVAEPQRVLTPKGLVGDWYVSPDARHEGIGTKLLHGLIQWFREEGCEVVESTTLPDNQQARRLHGHLGFHEVEIRYRMRL